MRHHWLSSLILLLSSLAVCAALFLWIDVVYTRHVVYAHAVMSPWQGTCAVPDAVRHHGYKPNCSQVRGWGDRAYQFSTNDLGFHDQRIRVVPRAVDKPRILLLGDSFTEGLLPWEESYVGVIAAHFPAYDFLNAGVTSYSPSNYLNVVRTVLKKGYEIDEAIVFLDISDVQDEAAYYRDLDTAGAVTGPEKEEVPVGTWYSRRRQSVRRHLMITDRLWTFAEKALSEFGVSVLPVDAGPNLFDLERSAWTYREVDETLPYSAGYYPLGKAGGIAKEEQKMGLLWRELEEHNVPLSVVVYPWPAQILHDSADSLQVRIWRGWCEGKCRRFISLFPAFEEIREQCPAVTPGCWYQKEFVFGDYHYNIHGNSVVAHAVIESLEGDPPSKHAGAQMHLNDSTDSGRSKGPAVSSRAAVNGGVP
jgi:hypothetical protein